MTAGAVNFQQHGVCAASFADGRHAIRQIAALPYRAETPGLDAPVSILLVTSRESRRWVIPKGNPKNGLSPHVAAIQEAEEEAGVSGSICPTPIGSYQYRKRKGNGASLMVDVDVYPLAVTREFPVWKECNERERRWFSLAEAASAVEEEDLRYLIRSFGAQGFRKATQRTGMLSVVAQKTGVGKMFGWFQKLLPQSGNFFDLFEEHVKSVMAGADAMARLVDGGSARRDHIREVIEREQDADDVTRQVLSTVRKTFLTPFDRSAITSLINALDNSIDEMHSAVQAIDLYEVTTFEPEMRDLAAIVVDAARVTGEAIPLLRDIGRNGGRLHELTERLVRMEGHADEIHSEGLKKAFKAMQAHPDTVKFVVDREIYKHFERVVDAFEDVANEIDGIVIDHA